jgi:hypothetical protein
VAETAETAAGVEGTNRFTPAGVAGVGGTSTCPGVKIPAASFATAAAAAAGDMNKPES